jgi:hypothetical protein
VDTVQLFLFCHTGPPPLNQAHGSQRQMAAALPAGDTAAPP